MIKTQIFIVRQKDGGRDIQKIDLPEQAKRNK